MSESEQSLYDRICRFSIDDGEAKVVFSQRLSRENGWPPAYVARVIDEYKRFVLLSVVAKHPVVPSDQVNQVWHLHLTYTKSYWDDLCSHILGTPLHHRPTRGGQEEAKKHDRWYRKTLERYALYFGHAAPTDIWPDPSVRFHEDLQFQRINIERNWVIRKPRIIRPAKNASWGLLLILFAAMSGLMPQPFSTGEDHWSTPGIVQWLWLFQCRHAERDKRAFL